MGFSERIDIIWNWTSLNSWACLSVVPRICRAVTSNLALVARPAGQAVQYGRVPYSGLQTSPWQQTWPFSMSEERRRVSVKVTATMERPTPSDTEQWDCWPAPYVGQRVEISCYAAKQANRWLKCLLYVHRNRRLIRDGSPGRPPRLSHSSWALKPTEAAK